MNALSVTKFGLGTSQLFNGKLKNNLDDLSRELFFKNALTKSNIIHTNANLGTQKKVADIIASSSHDNVRHVTKLECDLDSLFKNDRKKLISRIIETKKNCPHCMPFLVSIEIDYKGYNSFIVQKEKIKEWLRIVREITTEEFQYLPTISLFCKSKLEFEVALETEFVSFIGGNTNAIQSGLLFETIQPSQIAKPIIGYSPLARGRIFQQEFSKESIQEIKSIHFNLGFFESNGFNKCLRDLSLYVVLSNPNLLTMFAGVYNNDYLSDIERISTLPILDAKICQDILNCISVSKQKIWY